jgi:methionyl-tRNA formyltransferase
MDTGLDTGGVLLQARAPIAADETSATLHDKLAALGARSIVEALHRLAHGELMAAPQSADGASYARKIEKNEAAIDWRNDAAAIERRMRAFDPFPGASFVLGGETFKAWRGIVRPAGGATPGEVVSTLPGPLVVACGVDSLELTELQRPGGRRLAAARCLAEGAPARGTRLALRQRD